jgi:asparagine N-glycosylation enzyme membrane subunit Stt3
MGYNLTGIESGSNLVDVFTNINNASDGWLFSGILFSIFIIYLILFHKEDFKSVFLADSFITFIIGSLFFALGWIKFNILIVPIILIFIGIFMYMFME